MRYLCRVRVAEVFFMPSSGQTSEKKKSGASR